MKWINVRDEMPEFEDTVLMYVPDEVGCQVFVGYFDSFGDACWLMLDGQPAGRVTHWMHLPFPPKEQP